jgi:phosphate starvation-inducible PhoH-like protein
MARKIPAKRAIRPNPREDRNHPVREQRQQEDFTRFKGKKVEIIPKSFAQEQYLDALEDDRNSIVIASGPAGTGKSYLATLFAARSLLAGDFKKIIITRPTISASDDIGFLPGNVFEKLAPWTIPVLDVLKEVFPVATVEKLVRDEIVELAPLGMLRGRTFKNAIVIVEECQNATPEQMKMCGTRIGVGSRMIFTGDLRQHDRGFEANGLKDLIRRVETVGSNHIVVCPFGHKDIERHPVVADVLRVYGDD